SRATRMPRRRPVRSSAPSAARPRSSAPTRRDRCLTPARVSAQNGIRRSTMITHEVLNQAPPRDGVDEFAANLPLVEAVARWGRDGSRAAGGVPGADEWPVTDSPDAEGLDAASVL